MKVLFKILISNVLLSVSCSTTGQSFAYKKIPDSFTETVSTSKKERDSILKTFEKPFYIETALPRNYVKNGSKDYTNEIQAALNRYKEVVFPNFPLLINEKGLTLLSNTKVYFKEKSKLVLKPNKFGQHEILRIHDAENVKVYFANIQGDRYQHKAKDGEWGMGISIRGTKNILLYAPKVQKCWGDGIYLGMSPLTKSVVNENVKIYKGIVDDNRRNGMSIISAQNLMVNKFIAANSSGTPPHAGIDVEPDSNTDNIRDLNFNNIIVFNNETHGLLFALGMLGGRDQNIGVINVNNLKADTGYLGISLKLGNEKRASLKPKGTINIKNSQFRNMSRAEFLSYEENVNNNINVNVQLPKNQDEARIRGQLIHSSKFKIIK